MKILPEGVRVIPITVAHAASLQQCIDSVAREKLYLATTRGFPLEDTRKFVEFNVARNRPQWVAVNGERVVGWCDIIPLDTEGFEHSGRMGMGVLAEYRGRGIGRELAARAIRHAREIGLERVELGVFTTNTRAIRLYEQLGFATEGVKRRSRKCDGVYYDLAYMALFLRPSVE